MSVTNKQRPGGPTVRCVATATGVKLTVLNLTQAALHLPALAGPVVHHEAGTAVVLLAVDDGGGVPATRPLDPMAAVVVEIGRADLGNATGVRARVGWLEAPVVAGDEVAPEVFLARQHLAESPVVPLA